MLTPIVMHSYIWANIRITIFHKYMFINRPHDKIIMRNYMKTCIGITPFVILQTLIRKTST